jgi:hypothetical protein
VEAEMVWDGTERRSGEFHQVQAACIKRTADALAEGHAMTTDLERRTLKMISDLNDELGQLHQDIALLTLNVTNMLQGCKAKDIQIEKLTSLADSSDRRLLIVESWMIAERQRQSDVAKAAAESKKPLIAMAFSLVEKLIWLGLSGVVMWLWATR